MKNLLLLVAAAGFAASAAAAPGTVGVIEPYQVAQAPVGGGVEVKTDETIGSIEDVEGAVTITDSQHTGAATDGLRVVEDNVVTTGANGAATVVLDDGCRVHLEASQQWVVDDQHCGGVIALGGGGSAAGTVGTAIPAVGGAGILIAVLTAGGGSSNTPISGQ